MEPVEKSSLKTTFATMDGVRGVAALCVMLYHFGQHTDAPLFSNGPAAVDIFFCLSGFVIAHSYEARLDAGLTLAGFARIRLIRLYPLYLVGLALGLTNYFLSVRAGAPGNDAQTTVFVALYGLLLVPTFQRFNIGLGADRADHTLFPLNGPAWSLFVELASNGLFVVLRPRGVALALLLIALGAATLACDPPGAWGAGTAIVGAPRSLFSFYVGAALWRLWRDGALRASHRLAILPLLMTMIVCSAPDSAPAFVVATFIATPAIIALSIAEPRSLWVRRAFAALGEISYPIYAIHVPALGLLRLTVDWATGAPFDTPAPLAAKAALAVGLVLGSFALSRVYDRPVRRALTALTSPALRLRRRSA
jgi:peptidoglycan/LPS O-acetylase OafA/YrhL